MVSDLAHYRAQVAALSRHGATPEEITPLRQKLVAAKIRRVAAEESERQGLPAPSSDLEVIGFVASLLTREAA